MTYLVQPIDVKDVNTFVPTAMFTVVNRAVNSLYFILLVTDGFGERRYVPPTGTVVTLGFVKSRPPTPQSAATVITKTATVPFVGDASMMKVDLTADESTALITGGLTLTVGGVAYAMNNIVKKVVGDPGF
jgi:hypothetical protein